jgi:cytochrome c-type biogenesis protein CcmH/NrfG
MKPSARIVGYAAAACLLPFLATVLPAVAAAAEKPAPGEPNLTGDFQRCRAGTIDACYDAIRWRPSDPSLLSALGDAFLRANRPADALRSYQRVAVLAPNMPGVLAKISAIEAKLSAKHTPAKSLGHGGAADSKRYSNAAPETQSH